MQHLRDRSGALEPTMDRENPRYISEIDSYIPALDGVRGWAIIMVLFVHAFGLYININTIPEHYFWMISCYGRLGVDFFFVLSGFLITGILLKAKEKKNFFLNFYSRRTLRIFPIYYLVITCIFFITPIFIDYFQGQLREINPRIHLIYYAYLQNFLIPEGDALPQYLLGAMWSLAVEEHFYLVWPAIIYFCARRTIIKIICLLVPTAIILRCYIIFFSTMNHDWAFSWTICRMDVILIGCLLAIWLRSDKRALLDRWKYHLVLYSVVANIIIVILNQKLSYEGSWITRTWLASNTIGYTFHAIMFASFINLILFLRKSTFYVKLFDNWLLRLFGKHSYCIYIIHAPVTAVIYSKFILNTQSSYFYSASTVFLMVTFTSLLVSLIVWHLYEKHFLNLKNLFQYTCPVTRN